MKRLILILLALMVMFATTGFMRHGFNQGMDMGFGAGKKATSTDHKLFIDGAGSNYLLIDGSNHYLKIDGA